jgi:cephalosporin hydroxylase
MWLYQELLVQLRPTLVIEFGTFQGGSALYFATILSALPPHAPGAAPHKFKVLTVDIHGHLLHPSVAADARIEAVTASSTDALVEQRVRQLQQQCAQSRPCPCCGQGAGVTPLLQVSRPRVRHTGQRSQQGARAAGAARHRAPDTQGRPRGGGGQVTAPATSILLHFFTLLERACCAPASLTARSNVNGHPVARSHGPGPYEAIEAFLEEAPHVFVADAAAEGKFGFTAAPAGWLVRA